MWSSKDTPKDMEEILNDTITPQELEKFEKVYTKELYDKKCVSAKTQFEYGWCLIRSKYGADINNGIKMFESLSRENPDDKRDYIYYLAIAYCRIKDYTTAQKYVKAFLEIEPNNQQVLLLDEYIDKEQSKEFKKDAAIAGGALLVFGGLLGIGFALAKNYRKKKNAAEQADQDQDQSISEKSYSEQTFSD